MRWIDYTAACQVRCSIATRAIVKNYSSNSSSVALFVPQRRVSVPQEQVTEQVIGLDLGGIEVGWVDFAIEVNNVASSSIYDAFTDVRNAITNAFETVPCPEEERPTAYS